MKKQVILIRGGEVKENYKDFYEYLEKQEFNPYKEPTKRWNRNLGEVLGNDFEVISIPMPNRLFADYKAWKIMFEKVFPYLNDNIIFIGHSLGGGFLCKYFNETKNKQLIENIEKFILVAPAIEDIPGDLIGSFRFDLKMRNLKNFEDKIIIFASKDDPVVPFSQAEIIKKQLPNTKYRILENRGHFLQEDFKELVEEIKN